MHPKVTVIVTAYNHARYIGEALRSVLAQTYEDYEIIVVDDGSTDGTAHCIAEFGDRVRYVRQINCGVAAARNTGVQHARGELLAFLDGDDLWEPEKLTVQTGFAEQYPQAGLIAVDGVQFSEQAIVCSSLLNLDRSQMEIARRNGVLTGNCYLQLLRRNLFSTTSQVMIPASVLREIGPSNLIYRLSSDYDLYLRIAARYEVAAIPQPLVRWRYHPLSASGPAELRLFNWRIEDAEILKWQLCHGLQNHRPAIAAALKDVLYTAAQGAYYYGRERDRAWSRRYLLTLLAKNPNYLFIGAFLTALCFPQVIVGALSPLFRRAFKSVGGRIDNTDGA